MKGNVGKPAKRGDVFVFNENTPRVAARGDRVRRRIQYPLAIVISASRDGRVTEYRVAGTRAVSKSTPQGILLVSSASLDVEEIEKAYTARGEPTARAFKTLDEAREFIRPHLQRSQ